METKRPHVVIVGGGFAGLNCALKLRGQRVDVTVIDRKNHHTFQPLLYQVALAVLSPAEIASPIRLIFSQNGNVQVLLGEVVGFDLQKQRVRLKDIDTPVPYDYLVVASGAGHAYFGHDEWEPLAPGLKTVEDALEIRRRVLLAFESAERDASLERKKEPLNFVVVGAGPTGVELAGAIADIARKVMAADFRAIDPTQARVLLLEGGPRVLPTYAEDLSASAEKQLRDIGVEVRTNTKVTGIEQGQVRVGDEVIPSAVTLWAAGVKASALGGMLGATVKTDRAGRVQVGADLTIPEHKNVFVIGDLAQYTNPDGTPVPGVAPAAIQMGKFVGKAIRADLARDSRGVFSYVDKGSLATIGRSKAIGQLPGNIHLSGFLAWAAWGLIHVFFLIGFRNRVLVMLEWAWAYFSYHRGARLITDKS
jgi:NADH dehydrogenase